MRNMVGHKSKLCEWERNERLVRREWERLYKNVNKESDRKVSGENVNFYSK